MVPTINLPSQSSWSREDEIGGEYIGEPPPLSGQLDSPGGECIGQPVYRANLLHLRLAAGPQRRVADTQTDCMMGPANEFA